MIMAMLMAKWVEEQVELDDKVLSFSYETKAGLKHSYLTVSPDKGIQVKTPSDDVLFIKDFVRRKAGWIRRKQKEQVKALSSQIEFKTGSRIPYLGKQYYLEMVEVGDILDNVKTPSLLFIHSKFQMTYSGHPSKEKFEEALDAFYQERAVDKLPSRIRSWSKQSNLQASRIDFKKLKTRWASCGLRDVITFNIEVMKLPMNLIDYVIVHELAHIKHKNHSRDFWQLVRVSMPDYEARHQQINMKAF